jgi:hypothetical protein
VKQVSNKQKHRSLICLQEWFVTAQTFMACCMTRESYLTDNRTKISESE